jgi:hypothetical protein
MELLAFLEVIHASPLDGADVNEHISAVVVGLNEAKALLWIKPFYGSGCHTFSFRANVRTCNAGRRCLLSMSREKVLRPAAAAAQRRPLFDDPATGSAVAGLGALPNI